MRKINGRKKALYSHEMNDRIISMSIHIFHHHHHVGGVLVSPSHRIVSTYEKATQKKDVRKWIKMTTANEEKNINKRKTKPCNDATSSEDGLRRKKNQ